MTIRSKTLLILGALAGSVLFTYAGSTANSVHYSVDEPLVATGIDDDARGRVQALVQQKGSVHLQRMRVTVAKLDPKTPYTLLARIGDDSNLVAVTDFTTTGAGRAVLLQIHKAARPVPARRQLAEEFSPLTDVRSLAIANTNGEVVLSVDLLDSPSVQFELTSVLQNTGADPMAVGCLAVGWQSGFLQFRLFAVGQSTEFTLYINDNAVATYSADDSGRIGVGTFPLAAPSPLTFRTLSLRNDHDEVVLEQSVP